MKARWQGRAGRNSVRWIEMLLWVAGLAALGYCAFVLADTWLFQTRQAHSFDQASRRGQSLSPPLAENRSRPQNAEQAPKAGTVVGRIQITRLGLSAMIVEGIDGPDLRRAVGHIPGTALPGQPGNVGLAGHRDTFFRPLRRIHSDDIIELITLQGTHRYRVTSTRIVAPDDVAVLKPTTKESLTLVTCYPFDYVGSAPKRFIVRAELSVA